MPANMMDFESSKPGVMRSIGVNSEPPERNGMSR